MLSFDQDVNSLQLLLLPPTTIIVCAPPYHRLSICSHLLRSSQCRCQPVEHQQPSVDNSSSILSQHMLTIFSCDIDVNAGQMCGIVCNDQPSVSCAYALHKYSLIFPVSSAYSEPAPWCRFVLPLCLSCAKHMLTLEVTNRGRVNTPQTEIVAGQK